MGTKQVDATHPPGMERIQATGLHTGALHFPMHSREVLQQLPRLSAQMRNLLELVGGDVSRGGVALHSSRDGMMLHYAQRRRYAQADKQLTGGR